MALILQNTRFLHVPKTGGTYATQALQAACEVVEDFRIQGSDHTTLDESPRPELFTFAFVRHPLTWWQSMWLFHRGPARKYVVSRGSAELSWDNSTLIAGDVPEEIRRLKQQDGLLLQVHGSAGLLQTLLSHDLVDEFRLWTFPVLAGCGKRLFHQEGPCIF